MSLNSERLKYLFRQYLNDQATEEEKEEMLEWVYRSADDAPLQEFLKENWLEYRHEISAKQPNWNEMLHNIVATPVERKENIRRLPRRMLAAACIFLCVLGGIYAVLQQRKAGGSISSLPAKKDIAPGADRALLVMADGKMVELGDVKNKKIKENNGQEIDNNDGALTYQPLVAAGEEVVYNTIKVPRKGKYQLILSDGTRVWLNAESSLTYPTLFRGAERRVQVTGEAYFEVAKDAHMPFHVTHDHMDVEVLGTHFNVNTYEDEQRLKVTLLEGAVVVSSPESHSSVKLKPGQQSELKTDGSLVLTEQVDADEAIAWKEGRFQFDDTDLKTIMRQLMRWYDVDVEYRGELPPRSFTADISREKNLSDVLKIFELYDIHCSIEGKKLIVTP